MATKYNDIFPDDQLCHYGITACMCESLFTILEASDQLSWNFILLSRH